METLLAALQESDFAYTLRFTRWLYAVVNTTHVFGVALLVGAILPLDLRLLGFWPSIPHQTLVRVLSPIAAAGLAIAVCAGILLVSTNAQEYAHVRFLQVKLVLVTIGALAAITLHRSHGFLLHDASNTRLAVHGAISMTCWLGALICGRSIAFVME
jgi:hypothetical protein